jgi:hypothetical protein
MFVALITRLSNRLLNLVQNLADFYESTTDRPAHQLAAALLRATSLLCIFAAVADFFAVGETMWQTYQQAPGDTVALSTDSLALAMNALFFVGAYYNKRSNDRAAVDCERRALHPHLTNDGRSERALRRVLYTTIALILLPITAIDATTADTASSQIANTAMICWILTAVLAVHLADCDSGGHRRLKPRFLHL